MEITVKDTFLSSKELFPFLDLWLEGLAALTCLNLLGSPTATIFLPPYETNKFSLGKKDHP